MCEIFLYELLDLCIKENSKWNSLSRTQTKAKCSYSGLFIIGRFSNYKEITLVSNVY